MASGTVATARAHETGPREKHEGPPGMQPGEPSCRASRHLAMCLDVVTPPQHVCQEPGERRPLDDVGAVFRTLTVPDRGHVREIAGDLHTAAVVRAQAG